MENDQKPKKYSSHGIIDSEGNLSLSLHFPNNNLTQEQEEKVFADHLAKYANAMLQRGYLPPNSRLMSPSDIADEYGKSRQYWEKLLKQDKIPYKKTSAGMITCDLWVQGYLNNKKKVDEYILNRNTAVRLIKESKTTHGKIKCPSCQEERFDFNVNASGNMNGLCRSGCGFRINTTI
jgi:hypothetical protein